MHLEVVHELDEKETSIKLFAILKGLSPALEHWVDYEFDYALQLLTPSKGWQNVIIEPVEELLSKVRESSYYLHIQINYQINGHLALDTQIENLTQMLFAGLIFQQYSPDWVQEHFYFDPRGFFFLPRTTYFTARVVDHLGGKPFLQFESTQKVFDPIEAIGYQDFQKANQKIDSAFLKILNKLLDASGRPLVLAIAGPTAAGKTEIVEMLSTFFQASGNTVTSLELDHFLTDRDYRERMGIDSLGKDALHFELFKSSFEQLLAGQEISIPRYDFISATSSHDLNGNLKPGCRPITVQPASIIFAEGNSPFLIPEVAVLVAVKIVYLTDDPIRLKRKWRRDIDLRKKYEMNYLRNRYFKDQFLMAAQVFIPQMEMCDLVIDTTGAAIWASQQVQGQLADFLFE